MKKSIFIALAALSVAFPVSVSARETRCGWYGEALYLKDSQGTWIMMNHRGFSAKGQNNLPSFEGKEHIFLPRSSLDPKFGGDIYGCACLEVETNKSKKFITMIYGGEILPLSTCREDPNLPQKPY